ncbi:FadR family transcriptional regulator (plasmid) [Sphingomonas sp. NY01]|uniref:FadR/GntR family transcriptional regulator n=1 Tax=Sphingomonas sp. NY01 TaxID=2968057 RepID=UPI00315D24B3
MQKSDKLYRRVCDGVLDQLAAGEFDIGARLPTERELAETYQVSRTTVREAMVALEMLGIVDMRKGSGIYVVSRSRAADEANALDIGAFELMEARRIYEVETVGLAALRIGDDDLGRLEVLLATMRDADERAGEQADRDFHITIAQATGNSAMVGIIAELWLMRDRSDLARNIHKRARGTGLEPRVHEHQAILDALRQRDPQAAREAMRLHLDQVIEHLLARTELQVIEEARLRTADLRERIFGSAEAI